MTFSDVNLIRLFDFYLASMLVLGIYRRRNVYWDGIRLSINTLFRHRKLLDRLAVHRQAFLTRQVLRPLLLALSLVALQMILSRLVFPKAQLTVSEIREVTIRLILLVVLFMPMFSVDLYFLIRVGYFNRNSTEEYLDQAEHWLKTWKTPLIRTVTLGYVDPRRIVDSEVRKGLTELGQSLSWVMWWVSVQVGFRLLFGTTIWVIWWLK